MVTRLLLFSLVLLSLGSELGACDQEPQRSPPEGDMAILQKFREEFVEITPGVGRFPASFRRGTEEGGDDSERPTAVVTFAHHFAVAKYEVPQNLYQAIMGVNPSRWKGERNSVEMVTFDDAVEFCRQATERMREAELIGPDQVIRLPSEAEWEYAARAGSQTSYSFGDDVEQLGRYAWYTGNAAGNDPPVGAKQPNAWGLYDMHGYLWEWCADVGHSNHEGAPVDGSPRAMGDQPEHRVIRGGSWKDPAEGLRSAARSGQLRLLMPGDQPEGILKFHGGVPRNLRDDAVGFRCVLQ